VIVLSWDGTRHDYPERTDTPALDRMQREGARAGSMEPVFPSNTFPNHVSLATGTHPDRHGIVGNRFIDAKRGRFSYSNDASWIAAEPIWVAAERQGVRAATFFWVGSETEWNGIAATYRKAPFDSDVRESAKVDQILDWLALPTAERPGLIMTWWHGADHVGHERGPSDPGIEAALRGQDAELARLLAALDARSAWADTTLFVVSDHGMAQVTRAVDPIPVLADEGVPAKLVRAGGAAYVWLDDPGQQEQALELLRGIDGVQAAPSDAMPDGLRSFYPGRSGHITLWVEPPAIFARTGVFARSAAGGQHGFTPDHRDMHAIFYAMGRGVPAGLRPKRVHAIDLAATVCGLLGIEPPRDSEGRAVPGIQPQPAALP